MRLWNKYCNDGSYEALEKLLSYNREDVENLIRLRRKFKTEFKKK